MGYLPSTDAGLLAFGLNMKNRTSGPQGAELGLDSSIVASFVAAYDAYAAAYHLAVDPITRTKANVATKDVCRATLRDEVRKIVAIVQAHPGVTVEQRINLGITVRKTHRTPEPPPDQSPKMDIELAGPRLVRVKLHDALTNRRTKPEGVHGAAIFSYVGENPPATAEEWFFQGNTGRTLVDVALPSGPAETVWLTAMWFNNRGESGPPATPASVNLPAATATPPASAMAKAKAA